ncbi:MAG: signal recognition particle subunit SRP19/SEC65 family protein [Methanomassiliicoccales archaeon]|nr:MAG: signal recognition particle subunit SRP19/SEC65 family protein [Methanomassiliicoccales archaeon]
MPSRKQKLIVLYPEYFTAKYSRAEGRRVPKSLAKTSPTVDDIAKAAKSLGLKPVVEKDKSYPRFWYKKRGRVLVEKKMKKSELLKMIGKGLPG